MLAWVTGVAKAFVSSLHERGMNVLYFKNTYRKSTLEFGGIKSKGYDSVRILMNPEPYFSALPSSSSDEPVTSSSSPLDSRSITFLERLRLFLVAICSHCETAGRHAPEH
jgi:hypothetical protein